VAAPPGHHDGAHAALAGEAWLVLPTWQVAATGYFAPVLQSIARPVRIMLDAVDQLADDEGVDGDFTRAHDDQVPVEHWDTDLNQPMPPPVKPPSRQAQARAMVQDALARLSSKQSIPSST
jgi:hypothetical protein